LEKESLFSSMIPFEVLGLYFNASNRENSDKFELSFSGLCDSWMFVILDEKQMSVNYFEDEF